MLKKIILLTLIVVLIFALGACAEEDVSPPDDLALAEGDEVERLEGDGDVTLRVIWRAEGHDARQALHQSIQPFIDRTGIGIDMVYVVGDDWPEYLTKIATMVAAGERIDNARLPIEGWRMFVDLGIVVPIDDWITDNPVAFNEIANDMYPQIMALTNFNGRQFGIPQQMGTVVTHINTYLLEEAGLPLPPPDWDRYTFLEYAGAMTRTRDDGTQQFGVFLPDGYFMLSAWVYNFGGSWTTQDYGYSNLLDPAVADMFQFMQDLVHVHGYAPVPEAGLDGIHMLVDGTIGMGFWGRWPSYTYGVRNFHGAYVQYLPQFQRGTNHSVFGGMSMFTLRTSQNPQEAASFAVYTASAEFVEPFMGLGSIPLLNSVAERLIPALGIPQNYELYLAKPRNAVPVESPAQFSELGSLVWRVFTDIVVNQHDVESTLQEAHVELNLILLDNR